MTAARKRESALSLVSLGAARLLNGGLSWAFLEKLPVFYDVWQNFS